MVTLLCVGVVVAVLFAASLGTWLVHVARREGGLFHVKTGQFRDWRELGDYGAGRDADLLPQERVDNDYLRRMRAAEFLIDRMNKQDKEGSNA
jgi:hypothetical protein